MSSGEDTKTDVELSRLASITFDQTRLYLRDASDGIIASVNLCDLDKLSFSQWSSGIQDITKDPDPTVYADGDGVYTIGGMKVAASAADLDRLPTGIYIVKQGAEIQKVLHK